MPGKGSSGPWQRLKPVELDPLDSIGLPSKGDTRLLDYKTQERYYTKIVERYLSFCSDAGDRDSLLQSFASLSITKAGEDVSPTPSTPAAAGTLSRPAPKASSPAMSTDAKALSDVLMALRKLREGIVASKRADDFAAQAYLFCIRLSVLVQQPESYHPAILHLLRSVHPRHPLTPLELREATGYLVLDAACRRGRLDEAYALRRHWALRDPKVDAVLRALARDNYVAFRRIRRGVDGHVARMMDFAEAGVRRHALKCFGRAYLSVDVGFLERTTGLSWDELVAEGVGWKLEGDRVIIRSIKGRS
ncbi:sac3 ganp nin1 mts3 eif-3 p25 protein [Pleurostoma richardsiae]|uniref:Sac3 ganp nin1 mts3 eif-3 p25 protein n=1 Tax=Pleurostoma richardsiae TaxID=41990 RepID=A0AA38RMQ4_9PEZI|nr:sac3 ganp nin1 mts3 eif-3 p25 protein [Pleurostoma richardsiae]